MTKQHSEEEIQHALEILKKKRPEHANREQAINLLNTFENFSEVFVEKVQITTKLEKKLKRQNI